MELDVGSVYARISLLYIKTSIAEGRSGPLSIAEHVIDRYRYMYKVIVE